MIFNPPIKRNGVEVISVHEDTSTINFVVHTVGTPVQAKSEFGNARISAAIRDAMLYLEMEGFIQKGRNWLTHSGVMFHPKPYTKPSVKLNEYEQS